MMELHGAAAQSALLRAERQRAIAAELETFRAAARGLCALAAKVTGLPAPDALRQIVGRDESLSLIRLAYGPERAQAIGGNWVREEPARRVPPQASREIDGWGPLHDPRVVAAIGTPSERQVIAEVTREHVAAAAGRKGHRERQRDEMWELRDGSTLRVSPRGVLPGAPTVSGQPAQRSVVSPTVPELATERDAGPLSRRDALVGAMLAQTPSPAPAPAAAVAAARRCQHPREPGDRYCTTCGEALT